MHFQTTFVRDLPISYLWLHRFKLTCRPGDSRTVSASVTPGVSELRRVRYSYNARHGVSNKLPNERGGSGDGHILVISLAFPMQLIN